MGLKRLSVSLAYAQTWDAGLQRYRGRAAGSSRRQAELAYFNFINSMLVNSKPGFSGH